MTKKTVGYVELEWKCPACGTRNPGTVMKCTGCGAAQPQDVVFEQGVQEELLTDEAKIARAQAGPDVHCGFCGTRNPSTATKCRQCGAELKAGTKRQAGKVVGALQSEQAPPVTCAVCGAENPATALRCAKCGAPLAKPEAKPAPPAAKPAGRPLPIALIAVVGILLVVACIAVLLLSGGGGGGATERVMGQVSDTTWKRVILVQALLPVQRQNWRDNIPADATLGNCEERLYETLEEPVPGSIEVCGTPYVVDTGTGVGEVVQDCQYQVYEDYCTYTVLGWQAAAPIVLAGEGLSPSWPSQQLSDQQREAGREEEYVVTFQTEEGPVQLSVPSLQQFQQYTQGSRWNLEIDSRGRVVSVEPAQ